MKDQIDQVTTTDAPSDKLANNEVARDMMQDIDLSDDLEDDITLPYSVEGITLMSPGVWNNYEYTASSIEQAYKRTSWDDKEVKSIFWAHKDRDADTWIGEIVNPRLEGNEVVGDLKILDKAAAIKLAYGAKFGISPKVTGDVNNSGTMQRFVFDNFSVVLNPAVKTAYINNMEVTNVAEESDEEVEKPEESTEEQPEEPEAQEKAENKEEEKYPEDEDYPEDDEENSEIDIESLAEEVLKVLKESGELSEDEDSEESEPEESDEDSDDLSEEEIAEFKEFVDEQKKENPDMSFEEISAKFAEETKSPKDLVNDTKKELQSEIENREDTINELSEKVEDLEEKINEPDRATKRSGEKVEEMDTSDWSDDQADAGMLINMMENQGSGHLVRGDKE